MERMHEEYLDIEDPPFDAPIIHMESLQNDIKKIQVDLASLKVEMGSIDQKIDLILKSRVPVRREVGQTAIPGGPADVEPAVEDEALIIKQISTLPELDKFLNNMSNDEEFYAAYVCSCIRSTLYARSYLKCFSSELFPVSTLLSDNRFATISRGTSRRSAN